MSDETQGQLEIDGQVAPAKEPEVDYKAQFEEAERKREAAERLTMGFKRQNEQLQQQAQRAMRGQDYAQQDYGDDGRQDQMAQQRDQIRDQRMALIEFRQMHPDWGDYWPEMQEFLTDQTNAQQVAAFDHTGQPDWGKSWENTLVRVQNRRHQKARAAAEDAQAKATDQRQALNRAAVVTGDSGSEPEQTINITDPRNPDGSRMTSDQMIDAGLVDMDPSDPIRKIGTGKPRR